MMRLRRSGFAIATTEVGVAERKCRTRVTASVAEGMTSYASLSDLDPFALEPLDYNTSVSLPPPRAGPSPVDADLLQLGDPLSTHALETARKTKDAQTKDAETSRSAVLSRSPPRRPPRRMSSTSSRAMATIAPRRESIDAAMVNSPSTPPAVSVLSQFHMPRPSARKSLDSNESFSDFQTASSPPSLSTSFSHSLRSTWSSLKEKSTTARPAHANLHHRTKDDASAVAPDATVSYFSGALEFGGERAIPWHDQAFMQRGASPSERAQPPPVVLRGVREGLTANLTEDLAEAIRPHLPPRVRLSPTWTLLYSLDQHGVSLQTMYKRTAKVDAPCLLLVRDGECHVFGAFLSDALRRSDSYYGTGECFLWKAISFGPNDIRIGIGVKAFRWTGRNAYCILSNDEFVNVGGGDGRFGLWIDAALEKGFSSECPTFDNLCLCTSGDASEAQCEILALEVWRLL